MMLDYLENLRKKPEAERRKSVLYISIWITAIIALIWGIITYVRIDNTDFAIKEPAPSGVPSLKDSFSSFFDSLGNIFENNPVLEPSLEENAGESALADEIPTVSAETFIESSGTATSESGI